MYQVPTLTYMNSIATLGLEHLTVVCYLPTRPRCHGAVLPSAGLGLSIPLTGNIAFTFIYLFIYYYFFYVKVYVARS